jgi:hypothetical protein
MHQSFGERTSGLLYVRGAALVSYVPADTSLGHDTLGLSDVKLIPHPAAAAAIFGYVGKESACWITSAARMRTFKSFSLPLTLIDGDGVVAVESIMNAAMVSCNMNDKSDDNCYYMVML